MSSSTESPADVAAGAEQNGRAPVEPVEHRSLDEALAAAQAEFPAISKNKTGEVRGKNKDGQPYSYTYAYADLGDVLGAVRPVLARHGLALTQRTKIKDGGGHVLTTELRRTGDEVLDSEVDLPTPTTNPQAFGGILTYLRRYEAVTLLGIAAEEDTDAQHVEPERPAGRANGAPAELPGWAKAASDERLKELGEALVPVIGRDRARDLVVVVKANLGHVPDVAVGLSKALAAHVAAELGEAVKARASERLDEEAAKHRAQEAAAAAEGPDTPAPEEPSDLAGAQAAEDADVDEPPAEEPPPDTGTLDVDAADRPPAGTVEAPSIAEANLNDPNERDRAERMLRQAGCICRDPVTIETGDKNDHAVAALIDDGCPLAGHGIPF